MKVENLSRKVVLLIVIVLCVSTCVGTVGTPKLEEEVGVCSRYLTLGQAEGVPKVQTAVHVRVREGDKVLVPAVEDDKRAHRSTQYRLQ